MNQATHAHRLLLLVGLIFLSGALAPKAAAADTNPAILVPQWEPQAEFDLYARLEPAKQVGSDHWA